MGAGNKRETSAAPARVPEISGAPAEMFAEVPAGTSDAADGILDQAEIDDPTQAEDPQQEPEVGYVVAPGRTLIIDGRPVGPGRPAPVQAKDVSWLLDAGFLLSIDAPEESPSGVAVGGLKISGGRRPGGVVR